MKNFAEYIIESEKNYEFKIKIANIDLEHGVLDRIEHALKAFDVSSISKPKRLPICNKSLDFPTLENCEVNLIIASLKYPCTDEQVRQALSNYARLPLASIVVTPKNQPEEMMRDEAEEQVEMGAKKEAILTKNIEKSEGGQVQVGQKRLDSMLKELGSTKFDFEKTEKTYSKTTNELPQNNTSPMVGRKGSK